MVQNPSSQSRGPDLGHEGERFLQKDRASRDSREAHFLAFAMQVDIICIMGRNIPG